MNFQRNHLERCPRFPDKMKFQYKMLVQHEYWSTRKKLSTEFLRTYYAVAATEIGITEGPNGLVFGVEPNKTTVPSKQLQSLVDRARAMRQE